MFFAAAAVVVLALMTPLETGAAQGQNAPIAASLGSLRAMAPIDLR